MFKHLLAATAIFWREGHTMKNGDLERPGDVRHRFIFPSMTTSNGTTKRRRLAIFGHPPAYDQFAESVAVSLRLAVGRQDPAGPGWARANFLWGAERRNSRTDWCQGVSERDSIYRQSGVCRAGQIGADPWRRPDG